MTNPWDSDPAASPELAAQIVKPAEVDPEPWNNDPPAPMKRGGKAFNPEAPWESDPSPADWWGTFKSIPGKILGGAEKMVGGVLQQAGEQDAAGDYAETRLGDYSGWGRKAVNLTEERAKLAGKTEEAVKAEDAKRRVENPVSKLGAEIADLGDQTQEEANPGDMNYWQRIVSGGAVSIGLMAPALGASILTKSPVPALAIGGKQTRGESYAEDRLAGGDPEHAEAHSMTNAAAEVAFGAMPMAYLFKGESRAVLTTIVGFLAREVPSEVLTAVVQSANDRLRDADLKGVPWSWKDYGQDLLDAAGIAMVAGPVTAGIVSPIQRRMDAPEKPLEIDKIRNLDLRKDGLKNQELERPTDVPSPEVPAVTPPVLAEIEKPADHASGVINSDAKVEIEQLIASIDAELLTDAEVAEATEAVKKYELSKKAPAKPEAEAGWSPLSMAPPGDIDLGDAMLGASPAQAANSKNYPSPNTGDRLDWTFLAGPGDAAGLTPRQVVPQAGTYVLGAPSAARSAEFLIANQEDVETWRQKYLPDSTIVISNEKLFSNAALGWHYALAPNMHLIVPAEIRNMKDPKKFNRNTEAQAFYTLTHEFGHALVLDRLFGRMQSAQAQLIQSESVAGLVQESSIAGLQDTEQALVREYNAVKSRILDNSMTAQEFMDIWMSPGKLGREGLLEKLKVAPSDNAMAVVKAMARQTASKANNNSEMKSLALRREIEQRILSLDEYLAEQTARHAYKAGWDKTSALGRFFQGALDSLRKFFADLKKDGSIAPGTAFTTWIEGLSKADRAVLEADRKVANKKAVGKKAGKKKEAPAAAPAKVAKTPAKKAPAKKAKKKVETVEHNIATDTDEGKAQQSRKIIASLIKDGSIEPNSSEFKELNKLIREKEWDQLREEFQRYAVKKIRFSLDDFPENEREEVAAVGLARAGITEEEANDPVVRANAEGEFLRNGLKSKYVKAWFGDWENDPENAGKIRQGMDWYSIPEIGRAAAEDPANVKAKMNEAARTAGEPLVLQHATRGVSNWGTDKESAFSTFDRGDIGFHAGTARAALNRVTDFNSDGNYGLRSEEALKKIWSTEGADRARKDMVGREQGTYMMPVLMNLKNPLWIGREDVTMWASPMDMLSFLLLRRVFTPEQAAAIRANYTAFVKETMALPASEKSTGAFTYKAFAPVRDELIKMGYDGIVYDNTAEGDISYVAFENHQIKSVLSSRTFSQSGNLSLELDFDGSQKASLGARTLLNGIKDFVSDMPRLRALLRRSLKATSVLELQQLAHINPDVSDLAYMNQSNGAYNRYKSKLQAAADRVADAWSHLGKENFFKVNKFFLDELESGSLWFEVRKKASHSLGHYYEYIPGPRAVEEFQKRNIDEDTARLIMDAKNVLLNQLDEAEITLLTLLKNRYAGADHATLIQAMKPVKHHINSLRKIPFFPQGRFGNNLLIIEKKKDDGSGWEIAWREHFEDPVEWEKAWSKAVKNSDGVTTRVRKDRISDQHYVLMALPTDFIDLAASELSLSDDQLEILMNILQPVKREKVLSAYEQSKLGIKGYSADALRSFADFTWHNSNLLAKLTYRAEFNLAIRGVTSKIRVQKFSTDPASIAEFERLSEIKDFMEKTRDYVMSPPNEAQTLRAAVSIAYLGLNVKTAALNLWGLITTFSDLTTRLGAVDGTKIFLKAMSDTMRSLDLTDLNSRRKGDYLPADVQEALDRAIQEGTLSQSYAYHLAGLANSGNLNRLYGVPSQRLLGKIGQRSIDLAMSVFRLTELSARRATFLAEFEAAKRNMNSEFSTPYDEAIDRTNLLQNDYSLGNRVAFMRGLKVGKENPLGKLAEPVIPLATIFMSFAQHMAFHAYGGYELGMRRKDVGTGETPRKLLGGYTMKIWLLTLLAAGYEGLPGMENLLDLLELAWRKWGGKKPMRQELREYIQSIEMLPFGPQEAARGFGHNIAGFDISRSLGLGRLVPGTDAMALPRDSAAEQLGVMTLDLAGPTGGLIKFGLEAIWANDKARAFEKFPGGLGSMYTAYRWSQHGVRAPNGAEIVRDAETNQLRDLTAGEIAGKVLGLNPTAVSDAREILFKQYSAKIYWTSRRSMLLDDMWTAVLQNDREAKADVQKAIAEFNAGVPKEPQFAGLRVTPRDIAQSIQKRKKEKRATEMQSTTQRKYRGVYEEVRQSYDPPESASGGRP